MRKSKPNLCEILRELIKTMIVHAYVCHLKLYGGQKQEIPTLKNHEFMKRKTRTCILKRLTNISEYIIYYCINKEKDGCRITFLLSQNVFNPRFIIKKTGTIVQNTESKQSQETDRIHYSSNNIQKISLNIE